MNLIERYLQAISRELPTNQREDILKELRSSLYDALEGEGEATEERAVALIKEMGSPRKVAASYYPAGQYVIGPALYAMFMSVLKIVITSVLSVQLVLVALSFTSAVDTRSIIEEIGGVIATLPVAVGYVVLIFWGIQRTSAQPFPEEEFDPRKLPLLEPHLEPVSRAEQIVSIVVSVVGLSLLMQFTQADGFTAIEGWRFFENPVIIQYFPWLVASVGLGIAIDIILLWRGQWETSTRIASILANVFAIGVLYVLFEGHTAWLNAAGVSDSLLIIADQPEFLFTNSQQAGMVFFRFGMAVAIVVMAVETAVYLYKLIRTRMNPPLSSTAGLVSANQ